MLFGFVEADFAKNISHLANKFRPALTDDVSSYLFYIISFNENYSIFLIIFLFFFFQSFLPFQSVYCTALDQVSFKLISVICCTNKSTY